MNIEIKPWEMLTWMREGRIVRGNVAYTKSGTVYVIDLNGKWIKAPKEEAPALVYKFFALDAKPEEKKEESQIIVP